MEHLTVILRTCDRINAVSGGHQARHGGSKKQVLYKCARSLKNSIDYHIARGGTCNLVIVDDHSSYETLNFLNSLNANCVINLYNSGNGMSFGKCVDLAKEMEGLVFLIEDDYLLKRECLHSMVTSYSKIKSVVGAEICIFPVDYPDMYQKQIPPTYVVLGTDRHYKTVTATTCTFMYQSSIFKEFETELKKYSFEGNSFIQEGDSVNTVYKKYLCFSPIPTLAEHYQFSGNLSPFFSEGHYE